MTGHPKSDAPNPKSHLEHPGPESPMAEKGNPLSSSSNKSEGSETSQGETSSGARPVINDPGPAPEQANEEVKKHNEEVAKSHDRPANQIDEEGKVEKGFWTGESLFSILSWRIFPGYLVRSV
jgi:hypothetical protein